MVSESIRKASDPGNASWVAGLPTEELIFSAVAETRAAVGEHGSPHDGC